MTIITSNFAPSPQSVSASVHAVDASPALTPTPALFDWSRGSASKNSARTTGAMLPKTDRAVAKAAVKNESLRHLSENLSPDDVSQKVSVLINLVRACKEMVPQALFREARLLNAYDFAKVMIALQEREDWADPRYYVFRYRSGSVGSVWLDGREVYNSLWKNV